MCVCVHTQQRQLLSIITTATATVRVFSLFLLSQWPVTSTASWVDVGLLLWKTKKMLFHEFCFEHQQRRTSKYTPTLHLWCSRSSSKWHSPLLLPLIITCYIFHIVAESALTCCPTSVSILSWLICTIKMMSLSSALLISFVCDWLSRSEWWLDGIT